MADKNARSRADIHFSASAARDALVKDEVAKERVAFDVRTQKLRALRMAKEAEEQAEKAAADALKPAAKAKARKAAKAPSAKVASSS